MYLIGGPVKRKISTGPQARVFIFPVGNPAVAELHPKISGWALLVSLPVSCIWVFRPGV